MGLSRPSATSSWAGRRRREDLFAHKSERCGSSPFSRSAGVVKRLVKICLPKEPPALIPLLSTVLTIPFLYIGGEIEAAGPMSVGRRGPLGARCPDSPHQAVHCCRRLAQIITKKRHIRHEAGAAWSDLDEHRPTLHTFNVGTPSIEVAMALGGRPTGVWSRILDQIADRRGRAVRRGVAKREASFPTNTARARRCSSEMIPSASCGGERKGNCAYPRLKRASRAPLPRRQPSFDNPRDDPIRP